MLRYCAREIGIRVHQIIYREKGVFSCLNVHLQSAQGSVPRHAVVSLRVWMLKVMGVTFRTTLCCVYPIGI